MIPSRQQEISEEDIAAVVAVLRSDFLTQGPAVPRFEQAVAEYTGARFGIATTNATSALHLACRALGLGKGDRLWTSAISFVASANCARYCGADVDFVDIDPLSFNLDIAHLRRKLESAALTDTLPKVLVSVHLGGQPPLQEAIWLLAQEYSFRVIEDAAHSIGATRNGEHVGSCRWSDATVFSFHPAKIITTAEGGMVMTNDQSLAEHMRRMRTHGITRDRGEPEQIELGWNFRLTDLQAALGASQLSRIDDFVSRRNTAAARYAEILQDLPLCAQVIAPGNYCAYHLYIVRATDEHRHNLDLIARLRERGVGAMLHYPPIPLHPYYRALGFAEGMFPEAEKYARSAMSLPMYAGLSPSDMDVVARELVAVLANA